MFTASCTHTWAHHWSSRTQAWHAWHVWMHVKMKAMCERLSIHSLSCWMSVRGITWDETECSTCMRGRKTGEGWQEMALGTDTHKNVYKGTSKSTCMDDAMPLFSLKLFHATPNVFWMVEWMFVPKCAAAVRMATPPIIHYRPHRSDYYDISLEIQAR